MLDEDDLEANKPSNFPLSSEVDDDTYLDFDDVFESHADSESDAGSDASDFPSNPTLDDYLIRPREYMNHLEKLRKQIVQSSYAYSVYEFGQNELEFVLNYLKKRGDLQETTEILERVNSNIDLLHKNSFCTHSISMLVMDFERPDIVRLRPIAISEISYLLEIARDCLGKDRNFDLQKFRMALARFDLMLGMQNAPYYPSNQNSTLFKLSQLCILLDLSVIIYSFAHIARFDEQYFKFDMNSLRINLRDVLSSNSYLKLVRRSLSCLNDYLDHEQVWVWHPFIHQQATKKIKKNYNYDIPLKVSTYITDLADIWGLIWPVTIDGLKNISTFQAGRGVLVPRSTDEDREESFNLRYGYLYHWTTDLQNVVEKTSDTPDIKTENKTLILVGGDRLTPPQSTSVGTNAHNVVTTTSVPRAMLIVNTSCATSSKRITQNLKDANILRMLGTQRPRIYRDSETLTGSLGYMATLAGGITLKRSAGVTVKDMLCSVWKLDGGNRNPRILECWYGVEVSACSGNASRRRLKDIFSSKTMRRHLNLCYPSFEDTDYGRSFIDALASEDIRAFRKIWNENQAWQSDMQKLVSCCFEALSFPAVGENREMSLLWIDDHDQETIATIPASTCSWAGILKDTELSCTMAVLSQKCLEFRDIYGSKCRNSWALNLGDRLLETALVINRKALLPKGLRRNHPCSCGAKSCWDTESLKPRDTFSLGHLGNIAVLARVGHSQILAVWEMMLSIGFRNAFEIVNRNILKGSPKPHHWEAIDSNDEKRRPRPIGILLSSQKLKRKEERRAV